MGGVLIFTQLTIFSHNQSSLIWVSLKKRKETEHMHTCAYVGMHVCTHLRVLGGGFLGGSEGKESACNAGDPGLVPESGRSGNCDCVPIILSDGHFQKQGEITAAASAQVDKPLHFQQLCFLSGVGYLSFHFARKYNQYFHVISLGKSFEFQANHLHTLNTQPCVGQDYHDCLNSIKASNSVIAT